MLSVDGCDFGPSFSDAFFLDFALLLLPNGARSERLYLRSFLLKVACRFVLDQPRKAMEIWCSQVPVIQLSTTGDIEYCYFV